MEKIKNFIKKVLNYIKSEKKPDEIQPKIEVIEEAPDFGIINPTIKKEEITLEVKPKIKKTIKKEVLPKKAIVKKPINKKK